MPATEVISDAGLVRGDVHSDGGQARLRGDQGPRRIVGRIGGQCDRRQPALDPVADARGRLVQRRRGLRRQLRHPGRLDLQLPAGLQGGSDWSIVPGVPIDAEARKRLDASAAELISERDAIKELLGPAV